MKFLAALIFALAFIAIQAQEESTTVADMTTTSGESLSTTESVESTGTTTAETTEENKDKKTTENEEVKGKEADVNSASKLSSVAYLALVPAAIAFFY